MDGFWNFLDVRLQSKLIGGGKLTLLLTVRLKRINNFGRKKNLVKIGSSMVENYLIKACLQAKYSSRNTQWTVQVSDKKGIKEQ